MSRDLVPGLYLILGPSGVGKGTIIQMLRDRHPEIVFPVSATTRQPRPGERDGHTYYFLTEHEFAERESNGEFLETAKIHGKCNYGTLRSEIVPALESDHAVLREIDVQGLRQIMQQDIGYPVVSIFLYPPVVDEELMRQRIRERAPISDTELEARMESMRRELEVAPECTHILQTIDGDPEYTYLDIELIMQGQDYNCCD